tara:strand:+ start:447 stop:644 length:198 start_codon:yes stop_codon:yes gene_type:complete
MYWLVALLSLLINPRISQLNTQIGDIERRLSRNASLDASDRAIDIARLSDLLRQRYHAIITEEME